MNSFTRMAAGSVLFSAFTLSACEKEEIDLNVVTVNGMTVTLTPEAGGEPQSFTMSVKAIDDAGREHGRFAQEDITLKANTTYNATITFFSDKAGSRIEQNETIKKEERYYSVKYLPATGSASNPDADVEVTVADKKADGSPFGFSTRFRTGAVGMDAIGIELFASKSQGGSSMTGTVFSSTYWINVQN